MRAVQLRLGSRDDVRLWRANTGSGWVRVGAGAYRPQTFGVPGQPDLMGCLTVSGLGVWLGVEVKFGRGRQSDTQIAFARVMGLCGAVYILTRDPDDAERQLNSAIDTITARMKDT